MMRLTMDLRGGDDPVRIEGDPEGTSKLTSVLSALDAGGWDVRMVRRMPTEGILDRLRAIGVELDEGRFRELASEHWSSIALADEALLAQVPDVEIDDEDFVWMAAYVLWDRLLPGWPSVEQLDDAMQEGYGLLGRGDLAGAVARWGDAWALVKVLVEPSITHVREADGALPVRITQSLFNWCQDYRIELHNAALEDASRLGALARFSGEFVARFPDTDREILLDMRASEATALANLGDMGRSEALFKALVEDYPGNPWPLIQWGDSYWMSSHPGGRTPSPGDCARAEELYRRALATGATVKGPGECRLRDLGKVRDGQSG